MDDDINEDDVTDVGNIFISDINECINITEELPISHEDILHDSIKAFKESLVSTINKLDEQIDFMKSEIEEKNLIIRALTFREANDGEKIERAILEITTTVAEVETSSNVSFNNVELNCLAIIISGVLFEIIQQLEVMAFSTTGLLNTHGIFVFRHGKHLMY